MAVNFTPSLEPYKQTGSFKFWCQKVLPLVYDDSLSYYELLCKVVYYLNDVISNVDGLKVDIDKLLNAFNELQDYVNNYFDNLDVQEEINNKLDDMAESGALGTILIEALNLRMLQERKEKFQDQVRRNVVSYLARNYGGTYFETGGAVPVDNIKMLTKYSNDKSWQSYRWGDTPVYDETQNISGEDYHIMWCDCSSFSGLIYSGISYDNSPYMYGFTGGEVGSDEMILKGFPAIGYDSDWCLDFNSLENTDQMSYILTESGLNPLMLSTHKQGEDIVYNTANLQTLETGDIIFSGSGVIGGNLYENTGHCMVYIETVEELNEIAQQYGITFKPSDNDDTTWGFIAEVAHSTSTENDYTNCLNFGTLKHHMDRALSNPQNITYAYKITPRVTASNPASHKYSGIWRDYNRLYFVPIHYDEPLSAGIQFMLSPGRIISNNVVVKGEQIPLSNADANTLGAGVWRCTSGAVLPEMKNVPLTTNYFILDCEGTEIAGNFYGVQMFRIISGAFPRVWVRSCANGAWGKWRALPFAENGQDSFALVSANNVKSITVNFGNTFDAPPIVTATPQFSDLDNPKCGSVSICISNITTTGFTAYCFNNSDENLTVSFWWNATTNDGN